MEATSKESLQLLREYLSDSEVATLVAGSPISLSTRERVTQLVEDIFYGNLKVTEVCK